MQHDVVAAACTLLPSLNSTSARTDTRTYTMTNRRILTTHTFPHSFAALLALEPHSPPTDDIGNVLLPVPSLHFAHILLCSEVSGVYV